MPERRRIKLNASEDYLYSWDGNVNEETLVGLLEEAYSEGLNGDMIISVGQEFLPKEYQDEIGRGEIELEYCLEYKQIGVALNKLNTLYQKISGGEPYSPEVEEKRNPPLIMND